MAKRQRDKSRSGTLSQAQVARLFGVSASGVVAWGRRGCPRMADKRYELSAVCRWVLGGAYDLSRLPQVEILRLLGVSKPTIGEWERAGLPRNPDGTYGAVAVAAWARRRADERLQAARTTRRDLEDARGRKVSAEAEMAQLSLAGKRGDLLPRSLVIGGWIARYEVLKTSLLNLERRLSHQGLTEEQKQTVHAEIRRSLERLADRQVALELRPEEAEFLAKLFAEPIAPATDANGNPPPAEVPP